MLRYDSDWPLSKMLLKGTPHGVVSLPADRALAVAVSLLRAGGEKRGGEDRVLGREDRGAGEERTER